MELLLLRACVGVCKLMDLFRCTLPSLVSHGVEAIDAALHVALRHIVVEMGAGLAPCRTSWRPFLYVHVWGPGRLYRYIVAKMLGRMRS
jgi:hypothetical protein